MFIITNLNKYILKQSIDNNYPLDIFDTSNVTDMSDMCKDASSFNHPVDNFDTSNVTKMWSMFESDENFNQPLDNFDTSNVTDMHSMFEGATSMFIGYIMRFAARVIFVYGKFEAMRIYDKAFTDSRELDKYIIHLYHLQFKMGQKEKIDSALDGFIVV